MAEVFRAEVIGHEGFARTVAVKRMHPVLSEDPAFSSMFVREARLASLLDHPNIAAVRDFDRDDEGRYFLVMEFVDGATLDEFVTKGPVPLDVAAHIVGELLRALAYAHEREHNGKPLGIVHRDVTPRNVMVSWSGAVKLLDFGVARAVAATRASIAGPGGTQRSLGYVSPEQLRGEDVDGRADVFAAGVVFHELLTGQRLFAGSTEAEAVAKVLRKPIPDAVAEGAAVGQAVQSIIRRMLEREPASRCTSAREAYEDLLNTAAVDARGALSVAETLRDRFPGRAPHAMEQVEESELPWIPVDGADDEPLLLGDRTLTATEPIRSAGPRAPRSGEVERTAWPRRRRWVLATALAGVVLVGLLLAVGTGTGGGDLGSERASSVPERRDASGPRVTMQKHRFDTNIPPTPPAPPMPAHWSLRYDYAAPKSQIDEISVRVGARIRTIRNAGYLVGGTTIRLNVARCANAEQAEVFAAHLRQTSTAVWLRVGDTIFELVGDSGTLAHRRAGRSHLVQMSVAGRL